MDDSSTKRGWAAFMVSDSPNREELRSRRWVIRLATYIGIAVCIVLTIAFPPEWWLVSVIWIVVGMVLMGWYLAAIRRTARQNRAVPTPETQTASRRTVAWRFRWTPLLAFISAASLFLAGFTGVRDRAAVFVVAGLAFVMGVVLLAWTRKMMRT